MYFTDDDLDAFMLEVLTMTKTKFERERAELEKTEGKLFTIPEVSNLLRIDQDTLHAYIRLYDVKTFKIDHRKLLPREEVLKILAQRTSCLPMLKALLDILGDDASLGIVTLGDAVAALESLSKETDYSQE